MSGWKDLVEHPKQVDNVVLVKAIFREQILLD